MRNTSARPASAVPQLCVSPAASGWEAPRRLSAFAKTALQPGESRQIALKIDPRLLANYKVADKSWRIAAGQYRVQLARSSAEVVSQASVRLPAGVLDVRGKPKR